MAEVKQAVPAMQWGRQPDGKFFIGLALPVSGSQGQQIQVPFTCFLLTKDEEQSLRAALDGLVISSNGHGLAL